MIMTDTVVEKLVQKVTNMLEEMSDLNIQVRRLTPTQETLNRINERIDAMFAAIIKIEKGIQADENRLDLLETEAKRIGTVMEEFRTSMEGLLTSIGEFRSFVEATVQKCVKESEATFKYAIGGLINEVDAVQRHSAGMSHDMQIARQVEEERKKILEEELRKIKVWLIGIGIVGGIMMILILLRR
jgi:DNA repair ATPase RecN